MLQVIQQGQLRGAEVFALDLCTELAGHRDWDVSMLSLSAVDPPYATAVAAAGCALQQIGARSRLRGLDPRVAWRLRSVIDKGSYRIVQANGSGTLKYLVAARHLGRSSWRLLYRAIGMGSFWRRGVRHFAYSWMLAQPDRLIAVCQAVADDLTRAGGVDPRKIVVVPNGVSPARIAAQPGDRERVRAELGIGLGEAVLIYVGRLTTEKNVSMLITSVAACIARGIPARAILIGDGPARRAVMDAIRARGVASRVHLVPPQGRIGPYLAASDLCVLPSLTEGMPAALIEAGLSGLTAVAYAVGGVHEVVENGVTGVLVDPGDEGAFVAAVATLLTDASRREALARAAAQHYTRFTLPRVARAYQEVYAGLSGDAPQS